MHGAAEETDYVASGHKMHEIYEYGGCLRGARNRIEDPIAQNCRQRPNVKQS